MGFQCVWNICSTLLISVVICAGSLNPVSHPDAETFAKLAAVLEKNIMNDIVIRVTKLDVVKQAYTDLRDVEVLRLNGTKVLDEVIEKATSFLKKKEEALKRLYEAAIRAEDTHVDDQSLALHHVSFYNVKGDADNEKYGILAHQDAFRQNVSLENSGVHIPLEIYEGYPEILNGLKWSAALDKVFVKNMEEDSSLRWQYFGSSRGFVRIYPALRWPENLNPPDLYDVRRRPWYIHSIASPKDVIILIDKSGSVHGQTIDIMKVAVKALIRTLSEDDYVNVAWFNNEVNWVVPCLDSLMPATSQNKRTLLDAVDRLQESNLTSYETALEFAYNAFERFERTRSRGEGANCHKAIMFFSDGGTEWPQELSSHLCNDSTRDCVRVFTFGCGPHPIPTVILKSMACQTRGYFSSITALGAIQNRIQDYVRILGRPLVLSKENKGNLFHWNNIYIDKAGLGPVITVTLPVSGSSYDIRDPLLLGVVGTDIPTSDLAALYPSQLLGPLGYPFATDHNGYVVFHPQLHHHMSYLQGEDPPSIDFLEAEGGSDSLVLQAVRDSMVFGNRGERSLDWTIVPVASGRALLLPLHYFYGPMNNLPFRMGLAIPLGHVEMNMQTPVNKDRLSGLKSLAGAILAPWNYCPDVLQRVDPDDFLKDLILFVDNQLHKCNERMLRHLLFDLERTRSLTLEWDKSELDIPGVWSRFITTEGGLTLVRPLSRTSEYEEVRDPYKNQFYQRAVARGNCVLTPHVPPKEKLLPDPTVTVACPVTEEKSSIPVTVGVIGAEMEQALLQVAFNDAMHPYCTDIENFNCYIIDDGGFVVTSNQVDVKAGSFFGQVDAHVTEHLVNSGLFHLQDRFNLQAWCLRGASESTQSSSSGKTQFLSILSNLGRIFSAVSYYFYGLVSVLWPQPTEAFFGWELLRSNYSCITKTSWIVGSASRSRQLDEVIECVNCQRKLHVAPMPRLSAMLIMVDPPCYCPISTPPIHVTPQEDAGPEPCNQPKLARNPQTQCFRYSHRENGTSCYPGDKTSGLQPLGANSLLISASFLLFISSIFLNKE